VFVRLPSSGVVAVVNQQITKVVNEEGTPGKSRHSGSKEWISLNKREVRSTVSSAEGDFFPIL